MSPEPASLLLAFHDNPTFRASVTSIPNTVFFPNAASLAKIFVACVAVISVSFKPSGKRDVQGGKERKIKRVGGRAGKRKHRFLSFSAPNPPPPPTFLLLLALCPCASFFLGPLGLKGNGNDCESNFPSGSQIPYPVQNVCVFPESRTLFRSNPGSRKYLCRPFKYTRSDVPCDYLQICFSNQSCLTSCLISLSFQQ